MAPPKFSDISKAVTDLFADDFGFGATKLILKSKAQNGVNFKVEGVRADSGLVSGFLETKFNHASGLSVKEKWTTKNDVTTELSVENKFVEGSKLTAEAVFNPNSGLNGLKLKGDYAKDHINTNLAVSGKGVVSTAGVFSFGSKYLVGASADYDTAKGAVTSTKFAVGYAESDVIVTSSITNGSDVEGTVFHTPNSAVQAGLKFTWSKASSDTGFELAGKYKLDKDAFVKAKVDKALNLGLSYTQSLRAGVSLTLSANIKGSALHTDAHQLGLSLTLEQ
jgi:voltage-dependent anion channel protein 2